MSYKLCTYVFPWLCFGYVCLGLFCLYWSYEWNHINYIPIFIIVTLLTLGQSYECPSSSEVTQKDMEIGHSKTQQSVTCVCNSWDVYCMDAIRELSNNINLICCKSWYIRFLCISLLSWYKWQLEDHHKDIYIFFTLLRVIIVCYMLYFYHYHLLNLYIYSVVIKPHGATGAFVSFTDADLDMEPVGTSFNSLTPGSKYHLFLIFFPV